MVSSGYSSSQGCYYNDHLKHIMNVLLLSQEENLKDQRKRIRSAWENSLFFWRHRNHTRMGFLLCLITGQILKTRMARAKALAVPSGMASLASSAGVASSRPRGGRKPYSGIGWRLHPLTPRGSSTPEAMRWLGLDLSWRPNRGLAGWLGKAKGDGQGG